MPPQSVVQLLPEQLKGEGYTTGLIGKWHIGFLEDEREGHSTRPGHHPWERGFDYSLTHHGGMSHYFPYRADGRKWMTDRLREPRLQQKLEGEAQPAYLDGLPQETYLTDIFSDRGADFVRRHADTPWFLFLSYNAPHTPIMAPRDKMEKYAHIEDYQRRVLAAMMDSLDEGVGRVLRALEETDQTRDTLVWFLSDNGAPPNNGSRNAPFSGLKGDVFEGGIRVPFMAAWPGTIPGGRVVPEPVTSLDILPTALAAAGRETVSDIHDGRNLLPWLKGDGVYPKETLYWSWRDRYQAVRIDSLKEIRNGRDGKTVDGEHIPQHNVVDLSENPQELGGSRALHDPEKRAFLSQHLDRWLRQVREDAAKLTQKQ